jgi:hypothetical protein
MNSDKTDPPALAEKPSEVVSSSVPAEVAEAIREDAKSDDRSPSYVICQILKAHYAKRLKARRNG